MYYVKCIIIHKNTIMQFNHINIKYHYFSKQAISHLKIFEFFFYYIKLNKHAKPTILHHL